MHTIVDELRTASRTVGWFPNGFRVFLRCFQRFQNLRNHLIGTANLNPRIQTNPFTQNIIVIIQCRTRNLYAADVHRFQHRRRCYFSGTTHIPLHRLQHRDDFLWRKLKSNRPARKFRRKTEQRACAQVIHFNDNAIRCHINFLAQGFHLANGGKHFFPIVTAAQKGMHAKMIVLQETEHFFLGRKWRIGKWLRRAG